MDASTARKSIEAAGAKFSAALTGKDFKTLAGLYTEDGMVMPPDGQIVSGRANIEQFWKAAHAGLGIVSGKLRTIEVFSAGDQATEIGDAELVLASAKAKVKFIVLWQRGKDGQWRLHRDIWNGTPG